MISHAQKRIPQCAACGGTGQRDMDGVHFVAWLLGFVLICSRKIGSVSSMSGCCFSFLPWQIKSSCDSCPDQLSEGAAHCTRVYTFWFSSLYLTSKKYILLIFTQIFDLLGVNVVHTGSLGGLLLTYTRQSFANVISSTWSNQHLKRQIFVTKSIIPMEAT